MNPATANQTDMYAPILATVHTKHDADEFTEQLDSLVESFYDKKTDLQKNFEQYLSYDKKELILDVFKKNGIHTMERDVMQKFVSTLRAEIGKMPIVTIKVAFEPRGSTIGYLTDWFTKNLNKHVLFDVQVNSSLIAGVSIGYNGMYKDFSVRRKFDEAVKDGSLTQMMKTLQHTPAHPEASKPEIPAAVAQTPAATSAPTPVPPVVAQPASAPTPEQQLAEKAAALASAPPAATPPAMPTNHAA
jgi:F0F1-type ATP synthase delta subunit